MRTRHPGLPSTLLCAFLLFASVACERSGPGRPPAEGSAPARTFDTNEPATTGRTGPEPSAGTGADRLLPTPTLGDVEGPNFTIAIPPLTLLPQGQGQLALRVVGHSGFHINVEYPWRLRLDPPQGVTVEVLDWQAADASRLTEEEAVFAIPVTAGEVGQYQVTGHLRFSVCSESRCDVPRQDIGWSVAVQPE